MAASTIDGTPPAVAVLQQNMSDAPHVLRRRLLAEIVPSILHELSQPLTCVMLQQTVCARALRSDADVAANALAQAEDEIRRAVSLVQTMNLLTGDQAEPVANLDLNIFAQRAAELLRRELYDRCCDVRFELAPLPLARFSPTTALEAILRAIMLGSRIAPDGCSRMSVATRLGNDGRSVQISFRSLNEGGNLPFATATACSNYAHVARAIQSGGGRIDLCGDSLIIEFPVKDGLEPSDVSHA